jgi:hypothetical protein
MRIQIARWAVGVVLFPWWEVISALFLFISVSKYLYIRLLFLLGSVVFVSVSWVAFLSVYLIPCFVRVRV